jgi:DNA polymerase III epsilon subunit-like protein
MNTERPIGAGRCAERLGQLLGRDDVHPADIEALADAGHLEVVDVFTKKGRDYNLYDPAAVDELTAEQVDAVITARQEWTVESVSFDEARERLGWQRGELDQVATERALPRGQFRRFRRADIDALAADTELHTRVLADRLLTADGAAERMDIARRHFDIAVEAGWITPARYHEKQVGRYKTVDVPLYRTGDVDALLERPGVNWALVRDTGKGERSPLLDLVGGRPATRAQVIRAFLRDFGAEHKIEMWGWFVNGPDVWEIDWERVEGGPTKTDVAAAIAGNPVLRQYRREITLHSAAGAAIRFARAMLEPDVAVILDTETTDLDGSVIEVAVIDAATGTTVLDTLVNPGDVPITAEAFAVHGITDSDVNAPGVPDWPTVYKRLLRVTKDRIVLAYKADYDRSVIVADCARHGIRRTRLADPARWADVMVPRSDHAHSRRWLPNGGGHRALGDVQQTRQHLLRMTAPAARR